MHPDQLSLPDFPIAATPKPKRSSRPSLEQRVRGVEDRLLDVELEVTLLREQMRRQEEEEDE